MSGWPDDKFKTPLCVREYWPHRDELSIHNGLVYRGTRIIIPTSMTKEMTATAHPWHLGIHNTTSSVRDIMYRLWMTANFCSSLCDICQQTRAVLPKRPSMTYPIPNLPWQIVASDCFECDGSHYLLRLHRDKTTVVSILMPSMESMSP